VYTWNDEKNRENKRKHGFYLNEITGVFNDPHLLELYDPAHSSLDEERYICIGCLRNTMLYVITTDTLQGNTQIISARKATPKEENAYYEHYRQETGGD
jgi:uncharacterized DUF497 family protein